MFQTLKRVPAIPERVAGTIRERIERGALAPGSRLPSEAVLAEDFGVSRPTVREAISRLKQEGLVESRPGSGAYVAPAGAITVLRISPECLEKRRELRQILELRTSIEGDAAAYAALNRSAEQVEALATELARLETLTAGPADGDAIEAWFEAEGRFFRTIADASGNSYFVLFLEAIDTRLRMKLRQAALNNVRVAEMKAEHVLEHRTIFEAIRDGDAERARAASRAHFLNAARRTASRGDLRD